MLCGVLKWSAWFPKPSERLNGFQLTYRAVRNKWLLLQPSTAITKHCVAPVSRRSHFLYHRYRLSN